MLLRLEHYELLKGLGLKNPAATDLAILPNWPHVPRIGDDLTAHLAHSHDPAPGFLIAHHGITCWGRDLAQARNRIECLEAICQQLVLTSTLPTHPPVPAQGEGR